MHGGAAPRGGHTQRPPRPPGGHSSRQQHLHSSTHRPHPPLKAQARCRGGGGPAAWHDSCAAGRSPRADEARARAPHAGAHNPSGARRPARAPSRLSLLFARQFPPRECVLPHTSPAAAPRPRPECNTPRPPGRRTPQPRARQSFGDAPRSAPHHTHTTPTPHHTRFSNPQHTYAAAARPATPPLERVRPRPLAHTSGRVGPAPLGFLGAAPPAGGWRTRRPGRALLMARGARGQRVAQTPAAPPSSPRVAAGPRRLARAAHPSGRPWARRGRCPPLQLGHGPADTGGAPGRPPHAQF
ncbi:MAG: hypothetical protein J3K34DRAFT_446657 [Monoraphidium minutum]|nr:MAG: hypothetical protein J3K34DRAFT_446657 [Monoraphidium minutum]